MRAPAIAATAPKRDIAMLSTIFAVLSVAFGLLGFLGGAGLIGAIIALRARPRYLMIGGAASLLLGVAFGHGLAAQSLLYFPAIFFMMAGIGMLFAGWESEKEWQEDRSQVHELRMAQIHRQLMERRNAEYREIGTVTVPIPQAGDTERRSPAIPEEPAQQS